MPDADRDARDDALGLRPEYRGMSDAYMRRVEVAMALSAPDIALCEALLLGFPVRRQRLNRDAYELLRRRGVV